MRRRGLVGTTFAAVLIAACGASGAPGASRLSVAPSGGPATVQSSTPPEPSVAYVCAGQTVGCAGHLAAGRNESGHFERPFRFTVPPGWANVRDIYRAYELQATSDADAGFIMFTRAAPARQLPDCGPARREGFGTSVSEWMRSLTTDDRLEVSKPETFMVGTHQATRVLINQKKTFNGYCEGNSDPLAIVVTDTETPPTRHHGTDGRPTAMTLVDFGDDAVVIWNDNKAMVSTWSLPII